MKCPNTILVYILVVYFESDDPNHTKESLPLTPSVDGVFVVAVAVVVAASLITKRSFVIAAEQQLMRSTETMRRIACVCVCERRLAAAVV